MLHPRLDQLRVKQLRFLSLLATQGSLSATAEQLSMTQSAASSPSGGGDDEGGAPARRPAAAPRPAASAAPAGKPAAKPASGFDDMDDDIPF